MLEAKDLAKCDLSNYLTERLDSVLERDRALRAERDGCPLEAVSLCNSLPCMACCWGTSGFQRLLATICTSAGGLRWSPRLQHCVQHGYCEVMHMWYSNVWAGSYSCLRCHFVAEGLHSCFDLVSTVWISHEPRNLCRCLRHLG